MWNLLTKPLALVITATALAAGSAWYGHSKGKQFGMSLIQAQWDAERAMIAQAQAEEMMKARQREEALKALLARQRKEHRNEVNRIVREHTALTDSLRERAEARAGAGGVPEGAAAGVGCTGEGLARPDAQFLAGYAADAARLQSALNTCQAAYDSLTR